MMEREKKCHRATLSFFISAREWKMDDLFLSKAPDKKTAGKVDKLNSFPSLKRENVLKSELVLEPE